MNSRPKVHIVLSDKGWIIEECARQITDRLPYVSSGISPDYSAAIQYYMTYSSRKKRVSPIEIALFTHREEEPNAKRLFNETAMAVDHAIAMSHATEDIIKKLGVSHYSCISPGVDLGSFKPRLSIGVVGRTYHTGRKGEALVRAVMDIPDIDWYFTGEGWPGPALHIDQADLPDFYRSLDYVLVPATNEGGPMSVLEALSCGTPVIASDVGWASEFPHIPFARGDAQSLREVLERLRAERFALRDSVSEMTWENWASEHDALFAALGAEALAKNVMVPPATDYHVKSVSLVTHGAEDFTLGGPSVRVPRTREELEKIGLKAVAYNKVDPVKCDTDIVHGFNIWAPCDAYAMAKKVERLGKPFVFSPILLDLSEASFWQADLLRAFRASESPEDAERRLDDAFSDFLQRGAAPNDFEPGYSAALKAINEIASATIFLSDCERSLFERLTGSAAKNPHLVRNPVDTSRFDGADPDLFRATYGLDEYVLCIGRLEHRKNQLMLANALASTGLPLVLIGHEADAEYGDLIRRFGGDNLHVVGRIDPQSPLLASAVAGARVFTLPSWAEGAPLAALEAAAAGKTMVLSDRSSEREYFGDYARYCNPASSQSIRDEILAAWDAPLRPRQVQALRKMVREEYDWNRHACATRAVYETVYDATNKEEGSNDVTTEFSKEISGPSMAEGDDGFYESDGIIFDVTTWANNSNTLSGIVRVECGIARSLLCKKNTNVKFIAYSGFGNFIEIDRSIIESGSLYNFMSLVNKGAIDPWKDLDISGYSDLFVVGSSWMQNSTYAAQTHAFARSHRLRLNVLMHDFTPYLFPQWYAEGYADAWSDNCRIALSHADRVLVYSRSTARDTEAFCQAQDIETPPVAWIRLADEIGDFATGETTPNGREARHWFSRRPFILAVGGIHARKNYGLLYDVWTMLRQSMGDDAPHLAIVGGVSWNGQDVARAMQEDRRVNSHIRILQDIDDDTLGWLYENCLFTVYPSLYEGWGLPIGESLARSKICLASNTSSMVEIAPDLTDLLSPYDRMAWVARIQHYARSAVSREMREKEIREGFTITQWTQTTDDLLKAALAPSRTPELDYYLPGALALCNKGSEGSRFLYEGWYSAENWGAWAGNEAPLLALRLANVPEEDMDLTVLAQILKPLNEECSLRVIVNDVFCGFVKFDKEKIDRSIDQSVFRIRIPLSVLKKCSATYIKFESNNIFHVNDLNPLSSDNRKLGLGISAFMLEPIRFSGDAPLFFSTRPEIRAMLGKPIDQNLTKMLAEHGCRPCLMPDVWVSNLGDFVRIGTFSGDGAGASDGFLMLSFGTARLRLAEGLRIDFLIESGGHHNAHPVAIDLFANDKYIETLPLIDGVSYYTAAIPADLLGRSDPLRISLAGDGHFIAHAIRGRQNINNAVIRINNSDDFDLSNYIPSISRYDNSKYVEDLKIKINDVDKTSIIVFKTDPLQGVSINCCGSDFVFFSGEDGFVYISLEDWADESGELELAITLVPSSPGKRISTCQIRHLHLASPAMVDPGKSAPYIPLGFWNEVEADGTLWGATDTVSFLVRPGQAKTLQVHGEMLYALSPSEELKITVDGHDVSSNVSFYKDSNDFNILLDVGISNGICRKIDISGFHSFRPCDIGINGDLRTLSARIIKIEFDN